MRRTLVIALASGMLGGCVEQTLTITSSPPGAVVYLNDVEFGRTPVTREFTFYGTYDVHVRKEGQQALITRRAVIAPWWNWVPLDLIATVLPLPFKDRQQLHFDLQPLTTQPVDDQKLVERARTLEKDLPASQPAGK
jgi:hypothetical protein